MAVGTVSPVGIQQFFDNNGNPLAGGKLYFYEAGTTTPTPAYSDYFLTIPLPNPVVLDAAGRAPELFLAALTYKQVLKTAGDVTIWTADNIVTPASLRSAQQQLSITGIQNDLAVPVGVISSIEFTNSAPLTITGFAGGTNGQILLLRALGTARVDLLWDDVRSATGNHLINMVRSGPTTLVPTAGTAMYVYRSPWWILMAHEQGAWIRVPFNAATFSASHGVTADTWTVDAGDVVNLDYRLTGTNVLITVGLRGTTVGGVPDVLTIDQFPYIWRTTLSGIPMSAIVQGGSGRENAVAGMVAGTKQINFVRFNNTVWPAGSNGTDLTLQATVDVQ